MYFHCGLCHDFVSFIWSISNSSLFRNGYTLTFAFNTSLIIVTNSKNFNLKKQVKILIYLKLIKEKASMPNVWEKIFQTDQCLWDNEMYKRKARIVYIAH